MQMTAYCAGHEQQKELWLYAAQRKQVGQHRMHKLAWWQLLKMCISGRIEMLSP